MSEGRADSDQAILPPIGIVEGAIIVARALDDRGPMGRHLRLFRDHVKFVFGAA